jgi:hypothetical protein
MLADICGVMFDIVFPQYMFCFVDGGLHIFLRVEILIGKVVSFISEVERSLNLLRWSCACLIESRFLIKII